MPTIAGMRAEGIPANKTQAAYRMTLGGNAQQVASYGAAVMNSLAAADAGTRRALANTNRNAYSRALGPYGKVLGSRMFEPGMRGLGDETDDSAIDWSFVDTLPSTTSAPSNAAPVTTPGTGWMDILNTVVGNVSKGIATKIGGAPRINVQAAPKSTTPPWLVPVAVAGGVGALYFLMRRR